MRRIFSFFLLLLFLLNIPAVKAAEEWTVARAVDGDTLKLSNGERVRLIGVDTPETVHPHKPVEYFGKEASAFTKREIEGKRVRLEYDWNKKDKYGRTLAYVYREPDGFFLNAEIIRQGYGFAYARFPFKYLEAFRSEESQARETRRGLWADSARIDTVRTVKKSSGKVRAPRAAEAVPSPAG